MILYSPNHATVTDTLTVRVYDSNLPNYSAK